MSRLPAALEARIAELIAANEALVLSSLRMKEEVDASAEALRTLVSSAGQQAVDREYHYTQLRDTNEKLVVAALDARTLLDAAELARRRHTDFLAVLAHELRTPLTPIRMAASMLDEVHAVDFPRMKAIIERQVLHITRLLVDVLEVSRAGTGKMRLSTEVLDIAGIVDQAIDTCLPAMDARKQRLSASLPSAPTMIQGDPVRLAQVLVNLLDNASKYTPEGGQIQLIVATAGGGHPCHHVRALRAGSEGCRLSRWWPGYRIDRGS
jgi:signal transduction histidine kinase